MTDDTQALGQPIGDAPANRSIWDRCGGFASGLNEKFHFFVSLPVVTVIGSSLAAHFQYQASYQDKVNTEAKQQVSAAEKTYADVATTFAKAITLQQILFFDFRDATQSSVTGATHGGDDNALETKNARAIFPTYDNLRISMRQNIDLLAREVELNLDWSSDPNRDAAQTSEIGTDNLTRLSLGYYSFECEKDGPMPSFKPGQSQTTLPTTDEMKRNNRNAKPLRIDWYSTKHQLLTMYYCFEVAHRRIIAARQWAGNSPVDPAEKEKFIKTRDTIQINLNREAVRLNTFMTLAANRIELIQVKFRPVPSYCHLPVAREIIDAFSKFCTPIRLSRS